jgi:hypothetical protein
MAEEESGFKCPSKIEIVPTAEIFSFDFTFKMSGTENANIDYSTKPITLSTKPFKYDILRINKGINDPISRHWPKIETLVPLKLTKKIKIFGKTFPIPFKIPVLTQNLNEIYIAHKKVQITFFTIPSFKFKINSSLNWAGSVDNTFSISCETKGGCILAKDTAALIDGYYNDGKKILEMKDASERTDRISKMLHDKDFYLLSISTALLTYLLRDGLAANYTIKDASGKLKWMMNTFYMEFGDLKINIPKFQIELEFDNILKDNPITVSGSPEKGLTVTVQLIEIPGGDFFELMLKGLQNTLNLAKKATGTDYDADYIKELEDILDQLNKDDDVVTKWIKKYLGISFTIILSFVFCPAGMANVPPTPFYLKVELDLNINPYKILDDLFDAAEVIQDALSKFENDFMDEVKEISPSFAHPLEKILQGALNTFNKELKTATEKGKKMINNKYINKVYKPALVAFIPIEPPP